MTPCIPCILRQHKVMYKAVGNPIPTADQNTAQGEKTKSHRNFKSGQKNTAQGHSGKEL